MIEFIEVAGVKRPISFSLRIAYVYEVKFGRPYLRDVMRLSQSLQNAVNAEGEEQVFSLPLTLCADIFWAAFKNGSMQSGSDFSHEPADVAEWFLSDSSVLSTLMEMLMRSFPSEDAADGTAVPDVSANDVKNRRRRNGRK